MELLGDKQAMRSWSRAKRMQGMTIALVPTMGFLHAGHLSLVREAKKRADAVVVSIYVNPTQFAPTEDFSTYPRDIQGDLAKLQPLGVDAVFNPYDLYVRDGDQTRMEQNSGSAYQVSNVLVDDSREPNCKVPSNGQGHETWVKVERLALPLCGRSRSIFFRGVATVVTKLFHIVEPDVAVFGKKDYQQWRVICRMVRDLDFAVDIIGCELIREADGIAISSRNVYLSPVERSQALSISSSLMKVKAAVMNGTVDVSTLIGLVEQEIVGASGRIDYVEIAEQESLQNLEIINRPAVCCVAAWFGRVRLIDNIELQPPQSQ